MKGKSIIIGKNAPNVAKYLLLTEKDLRGIGVYAKIEITGIWEIR